MMPEGWRSATIGEIAEIQVGRDLKEEAYSEVATDQHTVPVFSNTVASRGLYGYYSFEEYPGNSITIVGRGIGIGTAFSRKSGFGAIGRLLIVSPKNNSFDIEYLENYTNFRLRIFNESGGIPQLPGASLAKYSVLLPPIHEQKKIAQILSTWDKAIETVEKLIKNSQQKKKALIQQLLTGKKRFPGFDGELEEIELSKLCTFHKGQGLSKGKLSKDGQYKCILYGELYTRYSEVINSVVNRTNHNEGVKSEIGDVLIPASTTTSGIDLANATSLKERGVLLSGDINILRTDKNLVNPDFLAYVLTHIKKHDLARRAQGITIIHLYGKDIKHIKVTLPSVDEQNKIVGAISSVEAEIRSQSTQLMFLRTEKKALMQQLLTGKRRVKVEQ